MLTSAEGKGAGKREVLNSHEEKIREVQKRKKGKEKQHGKCLLHMSTMVVVSTTLLEVELQDREGGTGGAQQCSPRCFQH